MAERQCVKCVKCGANIDKQYDYGWEKNEKTKRYTCSSCLNKAKNRNYNSIKYNSSNYNVKEKYSPKFHKISGNFIRILAIFIFVLSLLLILAVPPVGICFLVISVFLFLMGNKYVKKANAMSKENGEE